MEELHEIQYDGKTYKVYEPTIDIWSQLMVEKMFSTDFELALTLLSYVTGLTLDEIKLADAKSIINAADGLIEYYTGQGDKFYETFEFNGKKFKFIDIPSLSFGEYIDIDDMLKLPETEKHRRLNELLALFYREVDENGDYLPYDIKRIKDTALTFKKLPIKYLNSSLVFFLQYQQYIERKYPLLFLPEGMVDNKDKNGEEKGQKGFGWYATVISLSGENILNTDKVVQINHIEVFNFLTYMVDLNNKRERELNRHVKL